MINSPSGDIPIACDMTGAPDTPDERLAEYRRLFTTALVGKERTEAGLRFRLADQPGLADWVQDLSDREHACCPFMFFEVATHGDELWWGVSTLDDDTARLALDGLYDLPDSAVGSIDDLLAHYAERGLDVVATDSGFERAPVEGVARASQISS